MSSASDVVVVLSKVTDSASLDIVDASLRALIEDYDLGFRSYGGMIALSFDGQEFTEEGPLAGAPTAATALSRQVLEGLARRQPWFGVSGTVRVPDGERLIDLEILRWPTFDPQRPACVLFRLPGDLYTDVRKDGFDEEAADLLLKLCIRLGASSLVDAFEAKLVGDLAEVATLDGVALASALLAPPTIREMIANPQLQRGFVVGVKSSLLSAPDLRRAWPDGHVLETTHGFSVLSMLVQLKKPGSG
jgi:hypothetical protein